MEPRVLAIAFPQAGTEMKDKLDLNIYGRIYVNLLNNWTIKNSLSKSTRFYLNL